MSEPPVPGLTAWLVWTGVSRRDEDIQDAHFIKSRYCHNQNAHLTGFLEKSAGSSYTLGLVRVGRKGMWMIFRNAVKRQLRAPLLFAGILGLILGQSAPVRAQGTITLDHAVRNCRLIADQQARLACYDGVIDEADASLARPAPVTDASPHETTPSTAAAGRPSPAPASTPQAPASSATDQAGSGETGKKKRGFFGRIFGGTADEGIEIEKAEWAGDGGVLITTKDGTVWHQVDSTDIQRLPDPGDRMSITDSAFNQQLCQYGASPLFHCRKE